MVQMIGLKLSSLFIKPAERFPIIVIEVFLVFSFDFLFPLLIVGLLFVVVSEQVNNVSCWTVLEFVLKKNFPNLQKQTSHGNMNIFFLCDNQHQNRNKELLHANRDMVGGGGRVTSRFSKIFVEILDFFFSN